MTKTTLFSILGLGVFVVLIILLAGKGNEQGAEVVLEEGEEQNLMETEGKKMSFGEFLKQDKGSYECAVMQYIDEEMTQTTEGKVFLDAGRIRGDFSTNIAGMAIETSLIAKDGFVYTWTNMSPIGFKAVKDDENQSNTKTETSGSYGWDTSMIGDYDCQPWVSDASVFELPNEVTFQEM
jgi:hypothetical protein